MSQQSARRLADCLLDFLVATKAKAGGSSSSGSGMGAAASVLPSPGAARTLGPVSGDPSQQPGVSTWHELRGQAVAVLQALVTACPSTLLAMDTLPQLAAEMAAVYQSQGEHQAVLQQGASATGGGGGSGSTRRRLSSGGPGHGATHGGAGSMGPGSGHGSGGASGGTSAVQAAGEGTQALGPVEQLLARAAAMEAAVHPR